MVRNVLLAEFFNKDTGKYAYEVITHKDFNPSYLDTRYKELIGKGEPVWAVTDTEVDVAYEISYTREGIEWQTYRKLYFNESYRILYDKNGICEDLEEALSEALLAFADLVDRYDEPETILEDTAYDDDVT